MKERDEMRHIINTIREGFAKLGEQMVTNADKITAAFDEFRDDVSAKLDALTAKVNASSTLSDAEAAPILADIAAAKAKVDGATLPPVPPTGNPV